MAEAKKVVRIGPFKDVIADGVRSGDLLTLSGQVSIDAAGGVVGPGDIEAQVRQSYANIQEVLAQFDATMDDIVDETWFVTDVGNVMANMQSVFSIRAEAYGNKSPEVSQTVIGITALVMPELVIEIKVMARL